MLLDDARRSRRATRAPSVTSSSTPRAARSGGQRLADRRGAGVARGGADDAGSRAAPVSSAIARPMPREAPVTSATWPCRRSRRSCAAAPSPRPARPGRGPRPMTASASMRLTMPASTLPGPHSKTCVDAARARIACTTSTQRTGPKAWRYSASRIAAARSRLLHVDVVDHRNARRVERDRRQPLAQPLGGRLHQAANGTAPTPPAAAPAWRPRP